MHWNRTPKAPYAGKCLSVIGDPGAQTPAQGLEGKDGGKQGIKSTDRKKKGKCEKQNSSKRELRMNDVMS